MVSSVGSRPAARGQARVVLLPCRSVVERSFAWLARFRRLARDYERLPAVLAGLPFIAFACLLLHRVVPLMFSSYHALLRHAGDYGQCDPVLARIARIVDEADTVTDVELEPVASGLDLLCQELRRINPDDMTALEQATLLHDSLYAALEQEI